MTTSEQLAYLIPMAICLILSAYFSATETAFSTFNRTRIKTLAEKNSRAALVLKLSEKYDKLISTILVGNNIVNISISSIGTVYFTKLLSNNGDTGATISTIVSTVVVLIFGEVTPKNFAKDHPEKVSMLSAPIINLLLYVFTPFTLLLAGISRMVAKLFKSSDDGKMSQEELLMLVDEVQQDGSIDNSEGDLLRSAIEFTEQRAEDILTHRTKLIGFPRGTEKEEIAKLFADSQFSRLLVYEDNIDNIVGVLHQKDFFTVNGITDKSIDEIMKEPLFIHQTEKINDLLKLLQSKKSHMAIVIDEYGGTLGIVTMEDILEELVGDIWDEHDDVVENFKEAEDGSYTVNADISLDDFSKYFDVDIVSESVSVNGWIMEQLNKIPEIGDEFTYKELKVIVTATDEEAHRTTSLRVEKLQFETEDDNEDSDESTETKEKLSENA